MKTIMIFLAICICLAAQAENKKVTLVGHVEGLGNNEVVICTQDYKELARTKSAGGQFTIEMNVDTEDGQPYLLHFPSVGKLGEMSMKTPYYSIYLDAERLEVSGRITEERGFVDGELEGSPMKDEYAAIYDNLPASKPLSAAIDRYNKAFDLYNNISMTDENYQELKASSTLVDSLREVQRQQIFDMIPQKPKSKAMALMVFYYSGGLDVNEQEGLLNQFDSSIRECYGLRSMQKRIDHIRGSEVGAVAPDFELATPDGEKVKLSSFRGKYVLIDFWASWCGPCRKALPLVKKVYTDFKDKGLQVIGVSIDENEAPNGCITSKGFRLSF